MISYNPRALVEVLVSFPRSAIFRTLLVELLLVASYAAGVVYVEQDIKRMSVPLGPPILSLLGIILGLLLVFRTNTAYDRWWEGRRLWGTLVNASRALARQLAAQLPPAAGPDDRRHAWAERLRAFPFALALHLRTPPEQQGGRHEPNRLLAEMAVLLHEDITAGRLVPEARVALTPLLTTFDDVAGACERIRLTPIPLSYSSYIKQFIWLFALLVPFALAQEYGYGAVIAQVFLFFATAGIDLLASEIEEPFGTEVNDLPLEGISRKIARDVTVLLEPGSPLARQADAEVAAADRGAAAGAVEH